MNPLTFIHTLAHQIVVSNFEQHDWWLHFVVHVVLFVAPTALLVVVGYWLVRAARPAVRQWFRSRTAAPRAPTTPESQALVPGVFRYIWMFTQKSQFLLLGASLVAMPVLYVTLELPKVIINKAIDSDNFPIVLLGVDFYQIHYLLFLCVIFILFVALNGTIKYFVNVYSGYVAEGLLRRLRLTVYRRAGRRAGRRDKAALIPVITQEVEAVCGFANDAFVLPAFQGGTFLTILGFMFMQDPILAAASVTLLPIQLVIIPKLQIRVNKLARARMKEIRTLGSHIGDASKTGSGQGGAQIISIAHSIKRIQRLRNQLYQRKFLMKSLNNFIAQMTPFFFYSIGGYLVIQGDLSFGALVAVLAAYKDFSAPLRELFRYYQTMEDVRVRYEEIRRLLVNSSKTDSDKMSPPPSNRNVGQPSGGEAALAV